MSHVYAMFISHYLQCESLLICMVLRLYLLQALERQLCPQILPGLSLVTMSTAGVTMGYSTLKVVAMLSAST